MKYIAKVNFSNGEGHAGRGEMFVWKAGSQYQGEKAKELLAAGLIEAVMEDGEPAEAGIEDIADTVADPVMADGDMSEDKPKGKGKKKA